MAALGNAAPRGRSTPRQVEISRAGRAARAPRVAPGTPPALGGPPIGGGGAGNGGTSAPRAAAPGGGGGQPGGGGGIGIGRGEQPGLGHQLTRRVQSGAITGQQAQRTMQERQTLQKAFGADWRQHVFGGAGKIQQARAQLAASPNDPKLLALNQRLLAQRKQMLSAAKTKINRGSGGGGGARVNPQGRGFLNAPGQSY